MHNSSLFTFLEASVKRFSKLIIVKHWFWLTLCVKNQVKGYGLCLFSVRFCSNANIRSTFNNNCLSWWCHHLTFLLTAYIAGSFHRIWNYHKSLPLDNNKRCFYLLPDFLLFFFLWYTGYSVFLFVTMLKIPQLAWFYSECYFHLCI